MEQNKLQIFLCHATEDKPFVRDLYFWLKKSGFAPWLDEVDLLPGQEWEYEIPKAVVKSDSIIIVLSPNSISKRGYVQKEIRIALNQAEKMPEGSIYIIPIIIKQCEIPTRLSKWQWLDFSNRNSKRKLLTTLESLRTIEHDKNTESKINQIALGIKNGIFETAKYYKTSVASVSNKFIWLNWKIGQTIFQSSKDNNLPPSKIISDISLELTKNFPKGYSQSNLFNMYTFFRQFNNPKALPANLAWAHCRILISLVDEDERWFYLIEAAKNNWSSRILKEKIKEKYYEQNKIQSRKKEFYELIKSPYVIDFLSNTKNDRPNQ